MNASTEPCLQHAVLRFFSNKSKQDDTTTTAHRNCFIELLKNQKNDFILEYNKGKYG